MMTQMNFLEKSILATIVYYDILDYPLTGFEVYKYLLNPLYVVAQTEVVQDFQLEPFGEVSLFDVLKYLKSSQLQKFIDEKNGFYFLKNRRNLYEQRIERQKIASPRWKKAYKVIKVLQVCPFVRMIGVCNSLAINNSRKEADIYLFHWIAQIKPIYYENQIYRDFILKNLWVKNYLINFGKIFNYYHPEFKKNKFPAIIKRILEKILTGWFGKLIEGLFRFIQKKRITK